MSKKNWLFVDYNHLISDGTVNCRKGNCKDLEGNFYLFFFPECFAADDPALRDNEALRKKCLVPMVSLIHLSSFIFWEKQKDYLGNC